MEARVTGNSYFLKILTRQSHSFLLR